jgi:hypothetical protein
MTDVCSGAGGGGRQRLRERDTRSLARFEPRHSSDHRGEGSADSGQELAGVGETFGGFARGGPPHQIVDDTRHGGLGVRGRWHVMLDVTADDHEVGGAGVGRYAGEQLVEHHAGGVHVRPRCRSLAKRLLGRYVVDRAEKQAAGRGGSVGQSPRQPEVGDFDPAVVGD